MPAAGFGEWINWLHHTPSRRPTTAPWADLKVRALVLDVVTELSTSAVSANVKACLVVLFGFAALFALVLQSQQISQTS